MTNVILLYFLPFIYNFSLYLNISILKSVECVRVGYHQRYTCNCYINTFF